jgi:hypothetical protein
MAILQAQGAKPVGGIYQIIKGQDSTIQIIQLDESATQEIKEQESQEFEQERDDDENEDTENDISNDPNENNKKKAEVMAQLYAKAAIPKPILAEANFLMRTLSDDDQAFMVSRTFLVLDR